VGKNPLQLHQLLIILSLEAAAAAVLPLDQTEALEAEALVGIERQQGFR